jgi:exodeoxyribonuclease V alpha subunit
MIDNHLMDSLLRGLTSNIKLVLVGDYNQLPSVGAGNILKDLIDSDIVDKVELDLLYRQDNNSYIPVLANEIKNESHIEFNQEQEKAILSAFTEPLVIVTGGPGTGKTTIVHAIIKLYLKLNNDSQTLANEIAILAPTGRAAKRLKETTLMNSQTIHKFLGYMGGNKFTYNKYNKTSARLIIIDEASMMDLSLAHRLFTSMHDDARVIIVGDVDQLPSVGPGQILSDLINTKEIKTIRLSKIHRQAEDSSIVKLAHNVNEGIIPENIFEKRMDRNFIQTDNEHIMPMLVDLVKRAIEKGKDIQKDIQILVPMYRGVAGINEINTQIQELVNPVNDEINELKHLGRSFRVKDKVIQLVNRADKNIMNGDIGEVMSIKYDKSKPSGLFVMYDIGIIEYTIEELEDLALAYAVSVHKAQGSEFDIVIMPISTMHFVMLKRKLIYTAITRAKKLLILIGDVKAMQIGISKIESNRNTILKDKIIEYISNIKQSNKDIEKVIKIDDEESAFDTIGEKDFGTLTFDDFK